MSKAKEIAKNFGMFLLMLAAAKIAVRLIASGADAAKPGLGATVAAWF